MKPKFNRILVLLLALITQITFKEKIIRGISDWKIIPGANVLNKAIKRSTQTDFNGKYSIIAKSGQGSRMWA
jgi:hypothetical protein